MNWKSISNGASIIPRETGWKENIYYVEHENGKKKVSPSNIMFKHNIIIIQSTTFNHDSNYKMLNKPVLHWVCTYSIWEITSVPKHKH